MLHGSVDTQCVAVAFCHFSRWILSSWVAFFLHPRWFVLQAHGMDNDEIICRHFFFRVVLFYFRILSSVALPRFHIIFFCFFRCCCVCQHFRIESRSARYHTRTSGVRTSAGRKEGRTLSVYLVWIFSVHTEPEHSPCTHTLTNSRNNNNILLAVWYSV